RRVFAMLDESLRRVGGALADMVTMTVFIKEVRYGDRFVELRREFFVDGKFPASTLITVANFARPGMEIEIQGVAVIAEGSAPLPSRRRPQGRRRGISPGLDEHSQPRMATTKPVHDLRGTAARNLVRAGLPERRPGVKAAGDWSRSWRLWAASAGSGGGRGRRGRCGGSHRRHRGETAHRRQPRPEESPQQPEPRHH